jgi:uncharacterized repeat protein (TIGR01451 family)
VTAEASQGTCDTTGGRVACHLGTLRSGGSAQVLVTVDVTAGSGCVPNVATVAGDAFDPTPANNRASAEVCVEVPPQPPTEFDLQVDKRVSATRATVGQSLTYRVVVRNNGPGAAADAQLTDTYNAGASLVSVRASQGSCVKRMPMTCDLGRIDAGASVTIAVVIKPRDTGRVRNAASATGCCSDDRDPADNMDTADVQVGKVALRLSKVASVSSVRAGEAFSYRIRVRNPTKGEARKVRVCDRLPSGLRFVGAEPHAQRKGGRRCWTIKTLGAGERRTFRIRVRAAPGANGRKTNTATVNSLDARPTRASDRVRILGVATPVTG